MNNYLKAILSIVVFSIFLFAFKETFEKIIIKYGGNKVIAVVAEVPLKCDRYNHIKVLSNNIEIEVSISKANCKVGKYRIGQKVELLKHSRFKQLIWPHSDPEIILVTFMSFLVYFIYKFNQPAKSKIKKGLQVSS